MFSFIVRRKKHNKNIEDKKKEKNQKKYLFILYVFVSKYKEIYAIFRSDMMPQVNKFKKKRNHNKHFKCNETCAECFDAHTHTHKNEEDSEEKKRDEPN